MSDGDMPGDDPVLLTDDTSEVTDPDPTFDDSDEGADINGAPITSVNGSESDVWGGE